jgi:phthiocerol/phenolphthiocerol synthesis type-I polyketide synthase C
MSDSSSLVEVIRARAASHRDKPAVILLAEGETETSRTTYGELDRLARSLAGRLQAAGLSGERVLLPMATCLEYVTGMLGCLYAQAVAVPAYPPGGQQHAERLGVIVADSGARLALTTTAKARSLRARFRQFGVGELDLWAVDEPAASGQPWTEPEIAPDTLAYLQYTSGSTGDPRGVMVTHRSLLHQCSLFTEGMTLTERDLNVSWLPLFHDFGLVAGVLNSLYLGLTTVLIPPVSFAQRPARWLEAITHYRGTASWAPNFALDLCCERVDERSRAGLDLSGWRVLGTGAEPVRADTLDRFAADFAGCGFRPRAFAPGYGMAEATLALTIHSPGEVPAVRPFLPDALASGSLRVSRPGEPSRRLVGNGTARHGTELFVVDPDSRMPCPDGTEGEVWVRGETIADGYWMRPAETEASFRARLADGRGPFLRTGDLGALADGELYITGRRKDLIIIRGRNLHPHDVELTAARCHRALGPDRGAAFSVDEDGQERLVIVHELSRSGADDVDTVEIARAISSAVTREHEAEVAAVALLPAATLPLTSSGKVRRQRCKRLYLDGELSAILVWRPAADAGSPADTARGLPANGEAIAAWLADRIAQRQGLLLSDVGVDVPFGSLGLDSMALASITGELGEAFGRVVEPTLPYDHPTIARLARALSGTAASPALLSSAASSASSSEPVAVVGMACRFPGADSPEEYWDLLLRGEDAITEVPGSRWPADRYYRPGAPVPGYATTRWGGFIEGEYRFDAGFFGVSPAEARSMDPQQRLLLTMTLRALEDAGIAASSLAGSDTGVFVGISGNDYGRLQARDGAGLDAYSGTGNALSVAANRISFCFDLHGPSLAVDTACSSSLVAIHQALAALRRGECGLAIVAGVNLLLSPDLTVVFSQAGMMAPDGHCKVFDASADGYVRGEGCGVVLLKRCADAREAGDRVYAIVRGSAINSGGQATSLTAPNGVAQEAVLRSALGAAGLEPDRVGYIEAHGTGTALGDPVEVAALRRVYGNPAAGSTVWIGSAKASIGHLEAAAGIAGFIKTVLVLRHGVIPPQSNFRELNPRIGLDGSRIGIPDQRHQWSPASCPRAAGVSSFGFGGTNAHVIMEEAVAPTVGVAGESGLPSWELLPLSAKRPAGLRRLAKDWEAFLAASPEGSFPAICAAAGARRDHHPHRMAVVARSAREAAALLYEQAETGVADGHGGHPVAFVFTGQGSQYPGMADALYRRYQVFREVLDRCDEIIADTTGVSLLPALRDARCEDVDLRETRFAQPALFAVEYAMAALWRACGVEPDYLLGHSLGEYVAACVAGVMSEEDSLRLLIRRAELMQEHSPPGAMYAAQAPADLLAGLCAELRAAAPDDVAIAAVNSPSDLTLSGEPEAVAELARRWESCGARVRQLPVTRAFHSPLMAAAAALFEADARAVGYRQPRIGIITDLTGEVADGSLSWDSYWVRQFLDPVRFGDGVRRLRALGCRTYVEAGPHPVLSTFGSPAAPDSRWLVTLHRDDADDRRFRRSLAEHYAHGGALDWAAVAPGHGTESARLPGYPLTEQEYRYAAGPAPAAGTHPLLGTELRLAAAPGRWFAHTLLSGRPWFTAQHRVAGHSILPAAALLEWALAAARAAGVTGPAWILEHVTFNEPLVLAADEQTAVQAVVDRGRRVRCFGRPSSELEQDWTEHVTVALAASAHPVSGTSHAHGGEVLDPDQIYQRLAETGLEYGPAFRALRELWRDGDTARGHVQVEPAADDDYFLHPVILDACLHVAGAFLSADDGIWLPAAVDRVTANRPLPPSVWCEVRWHGTQPSGDQVMDLELRDDDGGLLAILTGLRLRKAGVGIHAGPQRYEVEWERLADTVSGDASRDGTWLVFSSDPGVLATWSSSLVGRVRGVLAGPAGTGEVDPTDRSDIARLMGRLAQDQVRIAGVVVHAESSTGSAPDVPDRAYDILRHTVPLIQHLVSGSIPLVLCSSGAAAIPAPDLAQSPLTGLMTAVAAEFPHLTWVQVDLDPASPAAPGTVLARAAAVGGAAHLAQRGDTWYRARVRASELPASDATPVIRSDGTYLVTGGWGGLGLVMAKWLAGHGARDILLVGRTPPTREPEILEELRTRGVGVQLLAADVATDTGIARITEALRDLPLLRGIIHAAGVTADAPLSDLDWPAFTRVLDPKVRGAWHLHRLADGRPLDMFVLFSSIAALIGSPGQANYVAANAFLDGLARHRRHLGLPAVSIAWAPWAETGMAHRRALLSRMERSGIHPLTTDQALSALDRLLPMAPPYVAVGRIDRPEPDPPDAGDPETRADEFARLILVQPEVAREAVITLLLNRVVTLLSLDTEQRTELRPTFAQMRLNAMGIDSLMAVQFRNWLLSTLSVDVPPHYLLGGSTVADVAELICQQLAIRSLVATEEDASDTGTEALTI